MDPDRVRKTESTVTFSFPFELPELGRTLPAGTYRLVTDEQVLTGTDVDLPASGQAYARVATMLMLPAVNAPSAHTEILWINPAELESALAADRATVPAEAASPKGEQPIARGRLGVLQRLRSRLWGA
jgi:hypothetical protein